MQKCEREMMNVETWGEKEWEGTEMALVSSTIINLDFHCAVGVPWS